MNHRLDIKPLSVNKAWQGKRYKTQEYKKFERDVLLMIPKTKQAIAEMIRIEFFFGFSSLLADLDNPVKLMIDILQKKYGFNDKNVFELNVRKCIVPKGKEFIDFAIYPLLPFE